MKPVIPDDEMLAFRKDLMDLLRKHTAQKTPADVCLAMASHVVGQILAMQDQRAMDVQQAMALIHENIVIGNQEAIAAMHHTSGNA